MPSLCPFSAGQFVTVSRKKLGLKYGSTTLEALWCFLDEDSSNSILPEEIAKFLKLAPTETKDGFAAENARAYLAKKKAAAEKAAAPDTARVDYALRTPDMRAKLAAEGHALPDKDRLMALSKLFNERLEDARKKKNQEGFSWYSLFKTLDADGSGYVTFDELKQLARKELRLKRADLSDRDLMALWCALDEDDSNQILQDEALKFLKLAPTETKDGFAAENARAYLAKKKAAAEKAAAPDTARVDYALRTPDMRAKLAAEGHALPDKDRLMALSKLFNERLEDARKKKNQEGFSWYSLFKTLDADGSGYVTFDELKQLARKELRLKRADLSDRDLMALWCALDEDDSNQILQDEALKFLKLAPTATRDGFAAMNTRAYREKQKAARAKALADKMRQVDAVSSATREMRAELDAQGVPPMTEGYLSVLSDQFNEWLETARETSSTHDRAFSKQAGQKVMWMLLFKEVDTDNSGGITYDEYKRVLRKKLQLRQSELSDKTMNSLWCALDSDNSDQIRIDEFHKFVSGNVAALLKPPKEKRKMVRSSRSPRRPAADPMAEAKKLEESVERTRKAIARRDKRIEEIQQQLRQLEQETPKPKLPRSGKSLPALASSSSPRALGRGPGGGGGKGVAEGPNSYPVGYLDPVQLQAQLKAALLEIARDHFVETHGGGRGGHLAGEELGRSLPLPPPPPAPPMPPPPGGRLPPLGLSPTTDDLERVWWEQMHGRARPEWYSGSMADTLSFRPIPQSRQRQRRLDKSAHGELVSSPRPTHNPNDPPPHLQPQRWPFDTSAGPEFVKQERSALDERIDDARQRLLTTPAPVDGHLMAKRRLRQSASAHELRVFRIKDGSWPQQIGMAAGA